MRLSQVTTVLLIGVVGLTTTSLALGTKAGTIVEATPSVEYKMNSVEIKEERVAKITYIVDKLIRFKVSRVTGMKQKTVKGLTLLAPFKVSNIGNSTENFVLNISYGKTKDFTFKSTVIYIDKNRNGKLEDFEKVNIDIVKNLKPDDNQLVWLGAVTPNNIGLNKRVSFGLKGEASSNDKNSVYKDDSKKNNILKEDIVFGDDRSEDDAEKDNIYTNRYEWSVDSNIELSIKLSVNIMSADPVNGICKNITDALAGNYFSIPGATNIRSWEIYNNTAVTATDIHFSVKANDKVEKFATSSKNTWWKGDSRVHILLSSNKKIIGVGKFNSSTNSVDFIIKEMKGGEKVYPHIVTEIK